VPVQKLVTARVGEICFPVDVTNSLGLSMFKLRINNTHQVDSACDKVIMLRSSPDNSLHLASKFSEIHVALCLDL